MSTLTNFYCILYLKPLWYYSCTETNGLYVLDSFYFGCLWDRNLSLSTACVPNFNTDLFKKLTHCRRKKLYRLYNAVCVHIYVLKEVDHVCMYVLM